MAVNNAKTEPMLKRQAKRILEDEFERADSLNEVKRPSTFGGIRQRVSSDTIGASS